MSESQQMRFSNLWSRSILIIDFNFCVLYIVDPFKWKIENFTEYISAISPLVIIGLWLLSSSLKSTVIFNSPHDKVSKDRLRISYYIAGFAAILIISGSVVLFFVNSDIIMVIGVLAVLLGLVFQIFADHYFSPFISKF